jgi:transcription antitermination factor NusG
MSEGFENHLHAEEYRWFAVYTRFKREKQVQSRLEERGIQTYLPLQEFTRTYTRKVRVVKIPLISCYLFVKITRKEYVPVLEDADVVRFVQFSRNLISIPESEINILKRVVGEGLEVEAEPLQLTEGDAVEIIGGQLTGLKGVLIDKQNERNLLIELNHIGYALRLSVPSEYLRPARQNAS